MEPKVAACVEKATGILTDGSNMCMGGSGLTCKVGCYNTSAPVVAAVATEEFCLSPGTSMSMSGFITSTSKTGQKSPCFIFLFPGWSLDTPVKFGFACFGTILLGILSHGLTYLKSLVSYSPFYSNLVKLPAVFVIYFSQMILAYALMLIAMTFDTELFFMVCFGLACGYVIFYGIGLMDSNRKGDQYVQYDADGTPCCDGLKTGVNPRKEAIY